MFGWFSMSKARYSMGNKQVSALQYASEMEPLVRLHVRTQDNGGTEFCTERDSQKCSGDLVQEATSIEDVGPREDGVRRRTKPNNENTEKEESEEARSKNTPVGPSFEKSDQNPQQDPLKWFGILVPQSLKHAQSSFQQGVQLSAEIATLQTEVLTTRQEMRRLHQRKSSAAAPLDKETEQRTGE
ncbi:coiled-coil domain-containing protein 115 isoform 2-T2 [Aulostomus maculatus]